MPGSSTSAVMTIPAAMSAEPIVTSARLTPAQAARSCSHDARDQVTAPADSATPPSVT